ncbi:MAG: DsrE/DsrF/DrsH-like family protein [Phycisphaerae bacterium]
MGTTLQTLCEGQVLRVLATDPGFAADIPAWCRATGNELLSVESVNGHYVATLRKRGPAGATTAAVAPGTDKTMVVFSNDLDRAMAAFVIANGAASMGRKVTMFFTFWGLNILRRPDPPPVRKGLLDRMFGRMMPRGAAKLTLSKMHMAGIGTAMMKYVMKSKNVDSLPALIAQARRNGVKLVACAMSMDVMGIRPEELMDGVEIGGVGMYLGAADLANVNLFI